MANAHADKFKQLPGCRLVAACDVDRKRAQEFATKHNIPRVYGAADDLFKDGDFDAVVNVTPDRFHAPISIQALRNGKHVLCEKPLAVSYAEAEEMARAARESGRINMVNFTYRNNAVLHKARDLVSQGALGRINHVESVYFQSWLTHSTWGDWRTSPWLLWRLSSAHGSLGALGDIGVHMLDFASYPVGRIASVHCRLKTFSKAPDERIGEYNLDANDSAVITVEFEDGALGSFRTTRWATGHNNSVSLALYGDEGALRIDLDRSGTELELCHVKDHKLSPWEPVECAPTPCIAERFLASIGNGSNDQPDFERGAIVQKALDACMQSHVESRTVTL